MTALAGRGTTAAAMPLALPISRRRRPVENPRDTLKKRSLPATGERVAGALMGLLSSFACVLGSAPTQQPSFSPQLLLLRLLVEGYLQARLFINPPRYSLPRGYLSYCVCFEMANWSCDLGG